jgi:hypothetical protein
LGIFIILWDYFYLWDEDAGLGPTMGNALDLSPTTGKKKRIWKFKM